MIQGIVFDLDGVLVDAVEWHYLALNRALSLVGYPVDRDEHDALYNGLPTAVKLELLSDRRGLPRRLHRFIDDMKQRYTTELIAKEFQPEPSVRRMIEQLKARGLRVAVASNSRRITLELFLERLGVLDLCDVVLSPEDVSKPKPDPEIYRVCFERLGLPPEQCLVIEDSMPGVQAARLATPNVVIVRNPREVTLDFVERQIECRRATAPAEGPSRPLQILVPMAGEGSRFAAAGFTTPKPFLDLFGRPMIQWVVDNIRPAELPHRLIFLVRESHVREHGAERILEAVAPGATIVPVPGPTEGAACTALLAADQLNPDAPLLLVNSDQWVDVGIERFLATATRLDLDGLIMTFPATRGPWSYARADAEGRVLEVAEKRPISDRATVGIYYFRRAGDFLDGAMAMIRRDERTNGEFYVCPVYNELLSRPGATVRIFDIPPDAMHGLGTPEDRDRFIRWHLEAASRGPMPVTLSDPGVSPPGNSSLLR